MAYSATWLEQGYYVRFSGTLTFEDVTEAEKLFFENEHVSHAKFQLYDFLDIENSVSKEDINPGHFAVTNKGSNSYIEELKVALVATGEMADICEKYIAVSQNLSSSWSFGLFDNRADAEEWANA